MSIGAFRRRIAVAAALGSLATPHSLGAHEVPRTVALRGFIKPAGTTLQFLVRVPLEAMRDLSFPTFGENYLDIPKTQPLLAQAANQWIADYVHFFEDGRPLGAATVIATRISLPLDLAFQEYSTALGQVMGPPLASGTELPWRQAALDVLFEYSIAADSADFSIDPQLGHLGQRTTSVIHFLPARSPERVFQYDGNPGLVRLDPGWLHAASRFLRFGVAHILTGFDHLLFLIGLIIPFRRFRQLVPIVTAFTVAHSITLIAAASGVIPLVAWFPPLVETLIAASIVFLAIENGLGAVYRRRWVVAFGLGLVHGFGFSFALAQTLQFAGRHLVTSLLAFNLGIEVGQLAVVALMVPLLAAIFRRVPERGLTMVLSLIVGHTAWHWMTERGSVLAQYQFSWDELGLDSGMLVRLGSLAMTIVAAAWFLRAILAKFQPSSTEAPIAQLKP